MATAEEIEGVIKELHTLSILVEKKEAIIKTGNKFKIEMPVTKKEIEVSISQSDINQLDNKIQTKKTEAVNMWKSIVW